MRKSPYEVLGISATATPTEIQKAYRRHVRETHPDKPGGSAEAFRDVNFAYELLKDEKRRAEYDRTGRQDDKKVEGPTWMQPLLMAFRDAVTKYIVNETPIGPAIKAALKNQLARQRRDIQEIRETRRRLEKLRGKITFKGEGENLFASQIESAWEQSQKGIETLEKIGVDLEGAIKAADEYEFPTDLASAQSWEFNIAISELEKMYPRIT